MAPSDTLISGLSGLQFSGLDNPYGLGASTLAASLPKLINPVGNVGTNLGIALGGTLLTALMGYQAQKTAADLTSRATQVGMDILAAPNVEQRKAIADAADEGFYGPEVKSKALTLVNALAGQEQANKLAGELEYTKKLKELEALTSPAGEEYMGLQTDKLLAGIQERNQGAQELEALRARGRQEFALLKSDIKANEGWLSNDQKLALKKAENAIENEELETGTDATLKRQQILANFKAEIDKAKETYKTQNEFEKIAFKDSLAKSGVTIPEGQVEELATAQDLTRRAYEIAKEIKDKTLSAQLLGEKFSAADDNSLMEKVNFLKSDFGKLQSGLVISKQEWERLSNIISGDWTAGMESKVDNLLNFGDTVALGTMNRLNTYGKTPADIYNRLSQGYQTKSIPLLPNTMAVKPKPTMPTAPSASMPSGAVELKAATDKVVSDMNLDEVIAAEQALVTKYNNAVDSGQAVDVLGFKTQAAVLRAARQRLTGQ
ncbi:MAG: hypothetical protein EBR82_19265 [Caulobacteraceae bacterium]|nr:hypothetical protein [Caulobacteraceae bacterium]